MSQRSLVFAVPGDPAQRTGGYLYDRHLADALESAGIEVMRLRLADGFPFPDAAAQAAAARAFAKLREGSVVLVDGLAFSVLPDLMAELSRRLSLFALIHHPLAHETGLAADAAERLRASERQALRHARRVVVTSPATKTTLMAEFEVAADRITVAMPGTAPAPVAIGSGGGEPVLLAVGSVIPRKDFPTLIEALGSMPDLRWRLRLAGSLLRDAAETARLRQAIAGMGELASRVSLEGELDHAALEKLYAGSDVFVSSSLYEGFGMALAEAVARGLPVVAIADPAVQSWLPDEAALFVPPGGAEKLAAGLRRVLTDDELRASLRRGAGAMRQRLPTWEATADHVAAALFGSSSA